MIETLIANALTSKITSSTKCRYFTIGFITAIFLAVIGGLGSQVYSSSVNKVRNGKIKIQWPDPPPPEHGAEMARYVVHVSDWASLSTISTADPIKGYPFNNVFSMSDGPVIESSGIPYMYMTPKDYQTVKDIEKDPRATMSVTMAHSDYCQKHILSSEDPRCPRVFLSGNIEKVKNGTREMDFAKIALFSRHPEMEFWPIDHKWFIVKMHITHIYLLDTFGSYKVIDIKKYNAVNLGN